MRYATTISVSMILIAGAAALRAQATQPIAGAKKINRKDGLTYVWIPPATFRMGCLGAVAPGIDECLGNELPRHSVTITNGFWIGQTLVTQVAYRHLTGTNPSRFRGDRLPVEGISWDAARNFCDRGGMRLPTEAEWEYASRGGMATERYGALAEIAWYRGNSGGRTHIVGEKQPNGYGLYDMLGNVWEWASDWYARYTPARNGACCDDPESPAADPKGPITGSSRVIRGGSWNDFSADVRMSLRDHSESTADEENERDYDTHSIGFRCAGDGTAISQ